MSQPAKVQEPTMEEILASIRRIIADDDAGRPKAAEPPPKPAPVAEVPKPAPAPPAANNQAEIDAMLADLDAPPKVAPKPAPKPAAPPPTDVLDLTEAMAAPPPAAPSFRTIDASSDVVFTDPSTEPPSPPPRAVEEPRRAAPPQAAADPALISNATRSAVDSAFSSLANIVLGANARTLEDLVKEMLRPMLKAWLDDNLPGMVERIVRSEIERVSRGR